MRLLTAFAAQCAQALDRIQRLDAERHAATATRRLSEALQRTLLTDPPQPNHLQMAVRYQPAAAEAQVGGDWYDAFINADGATTLVIGDVTGHDRDAAATMAQVRNVLRGIAYAVGDPPAAILTSLDRALRGLGVDTPTTAVLAIVEQSPADAERGLRTLRWANAGHPPRPCWSTRTVAPSSSRANRSSCSPSTPRRREPIIRSPCIPGPPSCSTPTAWSSAADGHPTTASSNCDRPSANSPIGRWRRCATRFWNGWRPAAQTTTSR